MDSTGEREFPWHFQPANQPKKSYAKRFPDATWSKFEAIVRRCHAEESERPREVILRRLREEGFRPTPNQLDAKLKLWGLTERRPRHNIFISQDAVKRVKPVHISPEDFPIPGRTRSHNLRPLSGSSQDGTSASSFSGSASETDDTSIGTLPSPLASHFQPCSITAAANVPPMPIEPLLQSYPYSKFTRFWEAWNIEELVGKASVVADFLDASNMFKEAFDVSYSLLSVLIRDTTREHDLLATTILACMRTASTPEQYGKALAITTLTNMELIVPSDFSDWFSICLNLHERDLIQAYGTQWPVLRDLPPELGGLGDALVQLKSITKHRECLLFAIRAREAQSCADLLVQVRLPVSNLYEALSIASSQGERVERYRRRGTGQRLLMWCATTLETDIEKIGSVLWEFAIPFQGGVAGNGGLPSKHLQHFLSDSLFRYLLRTWPRRPPLAHNIDLESSPLPDSSLEMALVWFELFEALAAFSALVIAESLSENLQSRTLMEAAPHILHTVKGLLQNACEFHRKFLDAYWIRMGTHASNISRNFRSIQLTQASLEFAASLEARPIRNFHLCDTGEDLWPAPVASVHLSVPALAPYELQPQMTFNDPMLWQRRSDSSSLYSHLSAIKHCSDSSNEIKAKRSSSAAMSVDSSTSLVRESIREDEIIMMDILENPWCDENR